MYTILWGILIILCLIIEVATVNLVTIWFCIGGLIALLLSLIKAPLILQIIAFLVVSLISIFMALPLAKKHLKYSKTNVDSIVGSKCYVTEDISNLENIGTIIVNGIEWKAKSILNKEIKKDTLVEIVKIEGVSAFVQIAE